VLHHTARLHSLPRLTRDVADGAMVNVHVCHVVAQPDAVTATVGHVQAQQLDVAGLHL